MGPSVEAHIPVLAGEVCDALGPLLGEADHPDGIWVDATAGLGGHTAALLRRWRPQQAVLIDRDLRALRRAEQRLAEAPCPIHYIHAPFSTIQSVLAELGIVEVAVILADLGVSSMQLDEPVRGFSFRGDGPLDMRMDPSWGPTAAELIARLDVTQLARILREFGEEPDAGRIAAALVAQQPQTTHELAKVVTTAMSAHQRRRLGVRIHPATRTFQALRIEVNGELDELDRFLNVAPSLLVAGGRLAVITFHSLEDRRVKRRFRQLCQPPAHLAGLPIPEADLPRPRFCIPKLSAQGITPGPEELHNNPRARSARLRILERCEP